MANPVSQQGQNAAQPQPYGQSQGRPPPGRPGEGHPQSGPGRSSLFDRLQDKVNNFSSDIAHKVSQSSQQTAKHSHTHLGFQCDNGLHDRTTHRADSFAPERAGNDVKWHVDGCSYMWAVSMALEKASHSIWILDCELARVFLMCGKHRKSPRARNRTYRSCFRVAIARIVSPTTSIKIRELSRGPHATCRCPTRC